MAIHVAIEGYDSLEQIGVGGMAAVYKARKTSIDKVVAIKVLFPYLASDASFTERFQREARAAASIQHDNVVNVIDFGASEGSCFIVMEYYDGHTLEDLMKSRAGVPLEVSAQILLEVAYGLEAAHALDIVHRDIKPANIIFTSQGGIKIADFGLAKKTDSMTMITQHGKVIGTPAYMSPEQAAGRPVGPASDIFSLGVVAYELLGRRKPFEGNTYSEVIEKIQTMDPPAVAEANPLVEPDFERVIARMLAKDERERYVNAGALITDFEAAMEKNKIARDRRRLAAYVRDPDDYDARSNEKTVTQCLSRGAFYMQKGEGHLDDALLEFRRIIFIDPTNERARKNLARIRAQRGDKDKTVTIDTAGLDIASAREFAPAPPKPRPRPHRKVPAWMYVAGVAGVSGLVAAMLWAGREPAGVTQPAEWSNAPASSAMAESPLIPTDPGGTPVAAAADSAATPPAIQADQKPDASAVAAKSADATPEEPRADDKATSQPVVVQKAARPAEPAASGTLSVFFLGGVGEVTVNGKPFGHQPPFNGVALPAGRYRIACRMTGDTEPREIAVTIAPNRETVIEYEMGGTPMASFGN